MKCPIDKTEMEKGAISIPGKVDTMWYSRKSLLDSIRGKELIAYRCPKCGKIELTTEPDK